MGSPRRCLRSGEHLGALRRSLRAHGSAGHELRREALDDGEGIGVAFNAESHNQM